MVSLVHGCAGCFTVESTWLFHAIWARQEPHVVHQRTIRPYPTEQKGHSRCAQCSFMKLSTTLTQDAGKTGGTMTGSTLRGGGVTGRRYHTKSRCGPTTQSPEELLRSSGAHTMLRARKVPACAARAYSDSGSRPQVPHSGHRGVGARSRRHANSRCGPTTRIPEELLRSSRVYIILRARMVPACAARAYLSRNSRPQVPRKGTGVGAAKGTAAEGSSR